MKKIAVFVSGGGTNCEQIIRHFAESSLARVVLVLSSSKTAYALERARHLGVPTTTLTKKQFEDPAVVLDLMKIYEVDFIVLTGFLWVIPDWLVEAFDHRMVNLHPALLPKFGGIGMYGRHVHEAVKAAGETVTGMTVHYVSNVVDGGEAIAQFFVPVRPEDTPETIAAKEHELEMRYFPGVIEGLLKDFSQPGL